MVVDGYWLIGIVVKKHEEGLRVLGREFRHPAGLRRSSVLPAARGQEVVGFCQIFRQLEERVPLLHKVCVKRLVSLLPVRSAPEGP